MSTIRLAVLLCLLTVCASKASATGVLIDGRLDEDIWLEAQLFTDFLVMQPKLQTPPEERTQALLTTDDKGIYVAFINQQSSWAASGQTSLFDQEIQHDYNQLIIDFEGKGLRGYGLRLSRSNVTQDGMWFDENQERTDWNGKWQHATSQTADTWTSEIFIPWSSFSMTFEASNTRRVSVYFARWHHGRKQKFALPAIDASQSRFLSRLLPIEIGSSDYAELDWFPYASMQFDNLAKRTKTQAGLDLFWRPSSDKQLSLTLNPDFAQVESDELVVNFSAIESFFEEKRPFFIENHAMFDIRGGENLMLVNTRRIGAKEDGQTDIDFAARFTQFSEQFEYGVLAAQEKDDGQRVGRDFLSGRWSWVQDTFSFGLLYNLTDDAGAQRQAQVVATDLVLEFSDKWQWSAIALQSRIEQKEANIEQSQTADGWSLTLAHQTATHWAQNWTLLSYEPQLEVNDFGYAERVDLKQLSYFSSYEWPKGVPSIGISDHMLEVAIELQQAQDGLKLLNEYEAVLIVNTESNLEWEFEFEYTEAGYDDLLTLGHHPVRMPEGHGVKVSFKSDQTKPWVWDMSYSQGTAGLSGHWREFEFEPTWQVNPNVHFGLEVTYLEQNSWLLSLFDQDELDQDEFEFDEEEDDNEDEDEEDDTESYASQDLVGEFEQSELTLAVNLAARWAQRHELSLKLETVAVEASGQSQWLVAATGRLALLDQVPESFSQSEFLLQLRYRYEIGPLSSLYLVYGRGGESETERVGHTDLRLMKDAFNKRDDENLAVKVSLHF